MWLSLLLIVTLLLYYWYKFCERDPKSPNILKNTPGPNGFPFVGSSWQLRSSKEVFTKANDLYVKYGKTVRVNLSIFPTIGTFDYNLVKFILSTNEILRKSQNYDWVRAWLGTGLVTANGHDEKWRKHRKLLTPAFHFEMLKTYVQVFESNGDILIEKLSKIGKTSNLDVHQLLKLYTLDVVNEAVMGVKMHAQVGQAERYIHDVERMCRIIIDRAFSVLKIFDCSFFLTLDFYLQRSSLKRLRAFTDSIIFDRIKENKRENHGIVNKKFNRKKMALLDLLLKTRENDENSLSFQDIREEVDTFMFAGHDTTSTAMSFILYCVADHPKVQAKLLQEQSDLFGDCRNPQEVTYDNLMQMKYLEMVIKETLRLYPPVPVVGRFSTKDVHIEDDDITIPKHVNLGVFLYRLHRDPDNFENPEDFIPERFEKPESIAPYAYVPFSAGARNCIGQKFAMLQMKSTISKIIRNFQLGPASPRHVLDLTVETVLVSLTGVKVSIARRQ